MPFRSNAAFLFALLVGCSGAEPAPSNDTVVSAATAEVTTDAPPSSTSSAPALERPKAEAYPVPPEIASIVASPDRAEADRALDEGRKPAEMLAFFGVAKGMKVAELAAGGGYTAELFARVVGPSGEVYGQNSAFILERFAEKPWSERLKKPVMKNVVRVDRPFDDPLPPEAKDLDGVYVVLFYHDFVWQKVDRDKTNKAIFAALKPGGYYGILDHAGRPGSGATETETLHRIEESVVREDVERAGFVLERASNFLRNPDDTLDWNASPRQAGDKRGTSDRFALLFRKPA